MARTSKVAPQVFQRGDLAAFTMANGRERSCTILDVDGDGYPVEIQTEGVADTYSFYIEGKTDPQYNDFRLLFRPPTN